MPALASTRETHLASGLNPAYGLNPANGYNSAKRIQNRLRWPCSQGSATVIRIYTVLDALSRSWPFGMCSFGAVLLLVTVLPGVSVAQDWGAVSGRVTATDSGFPIPGATVLVAGTNFGTATDTDGAYTLRLPIGRYVLRFSSVGFEMRYDSVTVRSGRTIYLDRGLRPSTTELDAITVESEREVGAGIFGISPDEARNMPTPMPDALRALRVLPGVVTNNELSNQFSVRGGGFNENLFFVNGFEIFLPFRPRTGEQEGLSLINPEMTERLTLYAGGFPVRYGGKLASAVDARYRRPHADPDSLQLSAHASLLDVGFSAGDAALNGRLGWLVGLRKAQARRFFETQELEGEYQPDYTDAQAWLGYRFGPGLEVEWLGMIAENEFRLDPNGRKTFFGTLSQNELLAPSNLQSLWVRFDDGNEEVDAYRTLFSGLRLTSQLSANFRMEHDASIYDTEETEQLDLSGTAILYQVDPGSDNPDSGQGLYPTGSSRQEDAADNRIAVRSSTVTGRYILTRGRHAIETGWSLRTLSFEDRLEEKSVVVGRATNGETVRIVADSLNDAASLSTSQQAFHLQDSWDVLADEPGRLTVTSGIRLDRFAFTGEWTLSPRASFTWKANPITTWFGSVGLYHQAPAYRELRGKPEVGESILGALNTSLASQRSLQFVLGGEYFIPSRRFFFRTEAWLKNISNLISYDIENVRVLYSGENDATGKAYGLDMQLRGELVPGMESWLNYSYLVAREEFGDAFRTANNQGRVARPTDQRHTVSLFVQDYIPTDPTWRLHLRTLYGSGLPYTPPVPGEELGNIVEQVPGKRHSARYTRFFRFDIGATKEIPPERTGTRMRIELTAEILNLFDMINTVSYSWIPDAGGIWQRIPTRLTPRTINVRLSVRF